MFKSEGCIIFISIVAAAVVDIDIGIGITIAAAIDIGVVVGMIQCLHRKCLVSKGVVRRRFSVCSQL